MRAVQAVDATLNPAGESCARRRTQYHPLRRQWEKEEDPVLAEMSRLRTRFAEGLFVGGGRVDLPRDNLDLERWFRLPKGHERRIHGRCHAGVRLVQEGPTLMLALETVP